MRIATALAEDQRGNQRRNTGVDVHHGTAGEVQRAHLEEEDAAGPDHVRAREIDDSEPDRGENHHPRELDALHCLPHPQGSGTRGTSPLKANDTVLPHALLSKAPGAEHKPTAY